MRTWKLARENKQCLLSSAMKHRIMALTAVPALLIAATAQAATDTWTGSGSANWSDTLNWSGGNTPPVSGDALFFTGSSVVPANDSNINDIPGLSISGITFDFNADSYALGGTNAVSLTGAVVDNASNLQTINLPLNLTANQSISIVSGGSLKIAGPITGAGFGLNLNSNGATAGGTLILAGANTYSGATTITDGTTLAVTASGTIGNGASNLSLGGTPAGTTGALDLSNASATVASLTVNTNTSTANTITLGGNTLNITGNVAIGGQSGTSVVTALTVTGSSGSLIVGNGSGGIFAVSNRANANGPATTAATADLSGIANFTLNYGSTGLLAIAAGATGTGDNAPFGNLTLAANNNITVGTLLIGNNNGGGNVGGGTLLLGSNNAINANTITVGIGKSSPGFSIKFNPAVGSPTLTLRGAAGGSSRVSNITISDGSQYTLGGSTNSIGIIDLTGGSVDAMVDTLNVAIGKAVTNTAASNGNLTFNAGTINVNNLNVGIRGTTAGSAATTGTVNVNGGNLVVNTRLKLADTSVGASTGTTTGILNITGGVVSMGADIAGGGGTSTVTLNGGTLDLHGHNLGVTGGLLTNVNLQSGTLKNVAQVNNGANITKTTTGTLTLDGVNTFSGATAINAGTLNVIGSSTGLINVNNNGILAGTGNGSSTGIVGNVSLVTGGTISPGTTPGSIGTLTVGNLTLSGGNLLFDLGAGAGANDLLNILGNATFSAPSTITVGNALAAGVYTLVNTTGALNLTVAPTLSAPSTGFQYILDTHSNAHKILLDVNLLNAALTWNGAADSTSWDLAHANWFNGNNNAVFSNGSPITFDDTVVPSTNINLSISANPASIIVNSSTNNYTISGTGSITGAGSLTKSGSSTFTLNTVNTYTGDTIINGGTVVIGSTGSIASGIVNIAAGANFIVQAGGAISSTTSLTNNGAATFNSNTTVSALNGSGTIAQTGTLTVTAGGNFSGTISDNPASIGALAATGGTLVLSGNNSYSGGTTINGATISISADNNLGNAAGALTLNGGTLLVTGTGDTGTSRAITLNVGGGTFNIAAAANNFSVNSAITGNGSLSAAGAGTITLTTANTYSGGTFVNGATLAITDDSFLGNPLGGITFNGGALLISGTSDTTTNRPVFLNSGVGYFNIADPSNNFSLMNGMFGAGGLGKSGPGTLTVSGNNTYQGNTAIDAGTLVVAPGGALGNGAGKLSIGAATNNGVLDLTNASATFTGLTAAANSTSPSTITLGAGRSLTINGNVLVESTGGNGSATLLTITGSAVNFGNGTAGSLVVGNPANGNGNSANATLDLSGVSTVNINYGSAASSIIGVGTTPTGGQGNSMFGTLILGSNNTLTASTLRVGYTFSGAAAGSTLELGTTNKLNINTVSVGSGKTQTGGTTGLVIFNSSPTPPTLVLRNTDGVSPVGAIKIGDGSEDAVGSGSPTVGKMDFTGASGGSDGVVDILTNSLQIGIGKSTTGGAATNGTLTFDQGTVNASSIVLAQQGTSNQNGASVTGIINVNGNATLIAGSGGILLGSRPAVPPATATITATININGGTVTSGGDILDGGNASAAVNSTVILNSGTLNLGGHNLGSAAAPIDNLTLNSGTLQNVGEINGGAALNLNPTSPLTLKGTNTYTGDTNVLSGEVDVAGSVASTNVTVAGGATLAVLSGAGLSATTNLTNSGTATFGNGASTIASLNAIAGANTTLQATTLKTGALILAGSTDAWGSGLNLTVSKLIVQSSSSNKAADLDRVRNQVAFGKTNADGIFTSATLAGNMGIAVLDNGVLNKTTFGGVAVDSNSILVGAELFGDANADGHVDLTDLSTVLNNFGTATLAWTSGNFDGAATIDLTDLSAVLNNFGLSNPNAFDQAPVGGGAVAAIGTPEPASLAVLGLGAVALLSRRRKA